MYRWKARDERDASPGYGRAPQPADFLAVDAGQQADAAVRLLLALKGEVVLGDVYIKLAQQLHQHGKRDPAADQEAHEGAQQARQGRMQLGWVEGAGGFAGHKL